MFKVKVIAIGRCKEAWLTDALGEYEKRLRGKMAFEWLLAKDETQASEWASKEPYIALHPEGKLLTSEEWSQKMGALGLKLNFVIGGAEGLSEPLLKGAFFQWSLSRLTFTHQMTRLILVEQLYRAMEIERGSRYHK